MGEPHKTNYGYAYSKRILDVQTKLYREQLCPLGYVYFQAQFFHQKIQAPLNKIQKEPGLLKQ